MKGLISYLLTYSSSVCIEQAEKDKNDFKVCCLVSKDDVKKMIDLVFNYDYVYNLSFRPMRVDLFNVVFCIDSQLLTL